MVNRIIIALLALLFLPTEAFSQRGSSRSYSSGSYSKPSRSYSSGPSNKPVASTPNKSYSSGNSSARPQQPKFDSLGREDKFKSDNRAKYDRGNESQNSYKTPSGQTKSINVNSNVVQNTRNNITEEKWVNRSTRMNTTFNNYTVVGAPAVVYHDHFNVFFWLWLLDRGAEERTLWAYHHQSEIDSRRLEELRHRDSEFDARLRKLEGQPRNANYSPKGIDEDLQYTDNYVDAVYNPLPKNHSDSSDVPWNILGWLYLSGFIVVAIIGTIYLVFFYRGF